MFGIWMKHGMNPEDHYRLETPKTKKNKEITNTAACLRICEYL